MRTGKLIVRIEIETTNLENTLSEVMNYLDSLYTSETTNKKIKYTLEEK